MLCNLNLSIEDAVANPNDLDEHIYNCVFGRQPVGIVRATEHLDYVIWEDDAEKKRISNGIWYAKIVNPTSDYQGPHIKSSA